MKLTPAIVAQLRAYQQQHALSQAQLGERLGCSAATVSRWLTGGKIAYLSPEHAERLAALLPTEAAAAVRHEVVRNTPELRACLQAALAAHGWDAATLARQAGYDRPETLRRLLAGEVTGLGWFPAMLSAVLTALGIEFDAAPVSPAERALLHPAFHDGLQARDVAILTPAHAATCAGQDGLVELATFWTGDRQPVPTDGRRYVAFRIEGASMYPLVRPGDVVLCDVDAPVAQGNPVVAKLHGQVLCKRYRRIGDTILLTSDNRAEGQDFEVKASEIEWLLRAVQTISRLT